jgi:Protein of unknown function (DUF2752)
MYIISIVKWLEQHQAPCFWKRTCGIECPGCGMQRAIIALLKGNLWDSILIYPALIPTIFLFSFLILHIIFKFKKGAKVILISFIFVVFIIITNFIIKLIF